MKSLKTLLLSVLCLFATAPAFAAGEVFFKGNMVSANFWTLMLNMGITTLINSKTHQYTYDNQMQFGGLSGSGDNSGKISGFSLSELFGNYGTGIRVGYKTRNRKFLNYAGFGSLDYKIMSDKISTVTEQVFRYLDYQTSSHLIQFGGGGNVVFGKETQKIQVVVDASILYDIPFGLSTDLPDCELESGFSSRYGVTVVLGERLLKKFGMHFGVWWQLSHHKYFKENPNFDSDRYRYFSLGFNFTICPWKK